MELRPATALNRPAPTSLFPVVNAPPDWMTKGSCRQADPEVFYPPPGGAGLAAKRVCRQCPVRSPCLQYAIDYAEVHGIWGGASRAERRAIVAGRAPRRRRRPINHGTLGGERTHRRRGEKACVACSEAAALYRITRTNRPGAEVAT